MMFFKADSGFRLFKKLTSHRNIIQLGSCWPQHLHLLSAGEAGLEPTGSCCAQCCRLCKTVTKGHWFFKAKATITHKGSSYFHVVAQPMTYKIMFSDNRRILIIKSRIITGFSLGEHICHSLLKPVSQIHWLWGYFPREKGGLVSTRQILLLPVCLQKENKTKPKEKKKKKATATKKTTCYFKRDHAGNTSRLKHLR